MYQRININGLPIPEYLLVLINTERWKCPEDLSRVDELFPDRAELNLYSLEYMEIENKAWLDNINPMFIAEPDILNPPGNIDSHQSLLIGDLGLGYDQPLALDYRRSQEAPCVVTLMWRDNGRANRWIEIAPNVRSFAEMLGL